MSIVMDFNYYVYDKKAYVSKKTLADKYGVKLSIITFILSNQKITTTQIDREIFYQVGEASKLLNEKTDKNINWK